MDEQARAALLISQSVSAMITALGMVTANEMGVRHGWGVEYDKGKFDDLIQRFGIDYNAATSLLQGR